MSRRTEGVGVVRKLLRIAIGVVILIEAIALLIGAVHHVGISLPGPFRESRSLLTAVLEAGSGVVLLLAASAIATRKRKAWKLAVAGHVVGVAGIAWGIVTGGPASAAQSSHHRPMLLFLIVALIALSTPVCRQALENGRQRHRRRKRSLQTVL